MSNQKERSLNGTNKVRELSKSTNWLAQYDEEDDFLCGKVSNPSPEFIEEE